MWLLTTKDLRDPQIRIQMGHPDFSDPVLPCALLVNLIYAAGRYKRVVSAVSESMRIPISPMSLKFGPPAITMVFRHLIIGRVV